MNNTKKFFALLFVLLPLTAFAGPAVNTYHNVTGAEHQNAANQLVAQGFRPTFIGVHGTKNDPRYSAVWLQRSGPAWSAFHGSGLSGYETQMANAQKSGLYPATLSVVSDGTGSGESVIAGSFEAGVVSTAKVNLTNGKESTVGTIQHYIAEARKNGMMPTTICLYGTLASPKWAVILKPNPKKVKWTASYFDTATENHKRFSPTVQQWARPIYYMRSSFDRYVSIYVDDVVGPWEAAGPMDWQTYQNLAADRVSKGFFPLSIQGGGSGAQTTWSVVFVQNDVPVARQFTVQGQGSDKFKPFDDLVKKYMGDYSVRAASLALVKNGKLVYAKGFTWAENGYPITTPTSLFRLASTSKAITSTAIHQLYQKLQLFPKTYIQNELKIKTPDGKTPPDERLDYVTVDQLLFHRGGWDRNVYDPTTDADVAKSYNSVMPVNQNMWIGQTFKRKLDFDPDSKMVYSNFGYMILGRILEKKYPGNTYEQIILGQVFRPLGIMRATITPTTLAEARPGQVRFHENSLNIANTVVNNSGDWAPTAYGGENYHNFDSFGGWMMASVDYAKFLASFELGDKNPILNKAMRDRMWENYWGNGWARGWEFHYFDNGSKWIVHHGGAMPGVGTMMGRRSDGISFVMFTNSGLEGNIYNEMNATLSAIPAANWPAADVDLFPSYNLPVNP